MRKYFYVITSIIQIAIMLFAFANVPQIVDMQMGFLGDVKEVSQSLPQIEPSSNTFDIFESLDLRAYFTRVYYVFIFIVLLTNLHIIELASENKILKKKGKIIFYYAINLVMALDISLVSWFISLFALIITATTKRVNENDFPDKIEKVQPLPLKDYDKKDVIKAVGFIVAYAFLHFIGLIVLKNIFIENIHVETIVNVTSVVFDLLILFLAIFIFKDDLKEGFKALLSNKNGYKKLIFKLLAISYATMIFFNIIRIIVTNAPFTTNQTALNELPFIYLAILAIFWAPFIEELVFRGCIRRMIKNKYVFIVVSAIIFGSLHAINEDGLLNIFVSSLPYVAIGACLAIGYEKTNNIWTSVIMHMINNAVAMIVSFMVFGG